MRTSEVFLHGPVLVENPNYSYAIRLSFIEDNIRRHHKTLKMRAN
jgi:hypothetical protein